MAPRYVVHRGGAALWPENSLAAVRNALAMGATKVFAMARDRELLEKVRLLDPKRVHVLSHGDQPVDEHGRPGVA